MKASLTRVGAIALKEFRHLLRDPRTLAVVLLMPVVQLLLFAYAISFDVRHVPTIVVDADRTPASRAYVAAYAGGDLFDVTARGQSLADVDEAFDTSRARVAVIVPAGTGASLARGEKAQVAVLVDGSEPNTARIASAYASALNDLYGSRITAAWADRQGLDTSGVGRLEPRLRTWYNPDRVSSIFLIPGLIVVVIMIVTVQQTAVTLVRERDQGTGEQMAISPLRRGELMIGKLAPWTILAFVDLLVIVAIGIGVFGVPLRGSVPLLAVASLVFVFAALAMGLIVSALAPSIETASIVALMISFLPAFLLSGFAFSLEAIPAPLQWLSHAFPGRYMVTISRAVFLKGAGPGQLWPELLQLSAYALVLLAVAGLVSARRRSS